MNVSTRIYRGRIIDLHVDEVTLPNGVNIGIEVIRHPGAAAVVAIDAEERVVLERQYRHAAGGFILEIPAGKLDGPEDPLVCAQRELQEEAGLVAAAYTYLGSILTVPGFCDERIHLFLARQLRGAKQALEPDEVLSLEWVPLRRALEMIRAGDIQDAKTIAGLHHAAAQLIGYR
jgi:ADP-ribose pyrophosphatase